MDNEQQIRDIVRAYNGTMAPIEYVGMWAKLNKLGIVGLCMGGKSWELPDGSIKTVDNFQGLSGEELPLVLVRIAYERPFGKYEYTQYVA